MIIFLSTWDIVPLATFFITGGFLGYGWRGKSTHLRMTSNLGKRCNFGSIYTEPWMLDGLRP